MAAALGVAYTLAGRFADTITLLTPVMEQTFALDMAGYQALCCLPLMEGHMLAGHLEEAQTLAKRALAVSGERQEQANQAYALTGLGEIATRREPPGVEEAQTSYRQALALANELGMRPLVAHCRLGLGRLYARMGQQEQARAELAAAIDRYRTMGMTFWLPQAEAMWARLSAD
jgi:tetratricopeptide (TPR) repeat protein